MKKQHGEFNPGSLVNESFRMSSGVFMVRHVTKDTEFTSSDGSLHLVRKGDKVAIYPPAIHKDPELFKDPSVSISLVWLFHSS